MDVTSYASIWCMWMCYICEHTGVCMCVHMGTLCICVSKCACLSLWQCVVRDTCQCADMWMDEGVSKCVRVIAWVCVGEYVKERDVYFCSCLSLSMWVVCGHAQTIAHLLPPNQQDNQVCSCQCQTHPLKKNKQHLLITFLYTISSTSTI